MGQRKTTVLEPLRSTRRWPCQRTARDRASASASRPTVASASRVEGVVDPDDLLLDDRTLVELGRHVVGGGADQLHPARVRLVVGLGALEAGQERVVDVDRPAVEPGAQSVGEHLHVAGQDHEVDVVRGDQRLQPSLGLGLGVGGDRDVHERQPGRLDHRTMGLVVRRHHGDLGPQAAGPPAEDQVVQAVTELGDHDQQSVRGRVVEPGIHAEPIDHGRERAPQIVEGVGVAAGEGRPEEEGAADPVVELLVLLDVQAVLDQERGDRVDDPRLLRAPQREHVVVDAGVGGVRTGRGLPYGGRGHPSPLARQPIARSQIASQIH